MPGGIAGARVLGAGESAGAVVHPKPKRRVGGAADAEPIRATFSRQTAASAIPAPVGRRGL